MAQASMRASGAVTGTTVTAGQDIGRAIGFLRRRRAITQADLANRSGVARSYLAQIEAGRTSALLEHELRLLRRLGATIQITWPAEPKSDLDG